MFLQKLSDALLDLMGGAVLWVPGGIGSRLRVGYYRMRGAHIGNGTRIDVGVMIDSPDHVQIGNRCWIDRYAILIAGAPRNDRETRYVGDEDRQIVGRIRIGDRCHIGVTTILSGIGGLVIEDDVTIAAGTKVYSLTHHFRSWAHPADSSSVFGSMADAAQQSMLQGQVTIGTNVGVGVDCLILPGVTVGRDSFIRPRSLVTTSFVPNSLIGGMPAVAEGNRFQAPTT